MEVPLRSRQGNDPFMSLWFSSWVLNLLSLCAADLRVAKGTEAKQVTYCPAVPCWLSCGGTFVGCWKLEQTGIFFLPPFLNCLDLNSNPLPALCILQTLQLFTSMKCLDPSIMFFIDLLFLSVFRVKPLLQFIGKMFLWSFFFYERNEVSFL